MTDFLGKSLSDLKTIVLPRSGHGAEIDLMRWIWKKGATGNLPQNISFKTPITPEDIQNIPPELSRIERDDSSGLTKFTTRGSDGALWESVIIPMRHYSTLCMSTQVGCRLGCGFCETGRAGFTRDLTAAEIAGQYFSARFTVGKDIRNIVFMGMGEPLDNADNLLKAIEVLSTGYGANLPLKCMTLSTAGLVDGIDRLASENLSDIRLAISLHGGTDEIRSALMPINRRYPLSNLKAALKRYPLRSGERFFIEYTLVAGINDSESAAQALIDYCEDIPVMVNLLCCNRGSDVRYQPPSEETVNAFRRILDTAGLVVHHRRSKGDSVMAACGQLAGKETRRH